MSIRPCLASISLVLLAASFPRADVEKRAAAEWPQWRGPDRSGVSSDTGLLDAWPPSGPRLLWTATNAGSGYSSVAISRGRLYVMGNRSDGEYLIAYDVATGRELWDRRTGEAYSNRRGDGPRGTPTVDGDRVYAVGANGDLWCVAATDGTPHWHVNVLERFGGQNPHWGFSESPLLDGDRIIALAGGSGGALVALDKRTGETIWRSTGMVDEPGYASAVLAEAGGVRQIVHVTSAAAVGVRAADGRPLWRYERVANDTANCTTPIHDDGHVFLTSGYDTGAALLQLAADGDGVSAREVYFTRDMINHHGGVVLVDGHVYGFSNATLTCLELASGDAKWRARSVGKGSLTAADGKLYLLSERGVVGLAKATPTGYHEVSRFSIPTQGRTWAHPVVVGGRLYIRNGDEIRCYDMARLPPRTPENRFADGKAAFDSGDWKAALAELEPLAAEDHPDAQNYLGMMYNLGRGVPGDPARAAELFRRAAGRGHARAQYNLGVLLVRGNGVDKDLVEAHLWFSLALRGGLEPARQGIEMCAESLPPEERAEVERRVEEWKPRTVSPAGR